MDHRTAAVAIGALLVGLLSARQADAFCRQNSCRDDRASGGPCQRDDDGCISEGVTLSYASACHSFGVAEGAALELDMDDEEFEAIVIEAFEMWRNVDCGAGRPPGFEFESVGVVEVEGNFFCSVEPTLNLSVWQSIEPWPYRSQTLGYTSSIFATDNGEVFDADVELNTAKIRREFAPAHWRQVLLSVIVHEAGHFLGLAHSQDHSAVMAESYTDFELLHRQLTDDDILAICTVYPPSDELMCSTPGYADAALNAEACEAAGRQSSQRGGCSVGTYGAGARGIAAGSACAWILLTWCFRRNRRGLRSSSPARSEPEFPIKLS